MADDLGTVRLVLAILRANGVGFDDAWSAAFPTPRPHYNRVAIRAALDETAEAWRRAYVGEPPTPGERAAVHVFNLWIEREDDAEDRVELGGSRCG